MVEDSDEDWVVLRRVLAQVAPEVEAVRLADGDTALEELRRGLRVSAVLVDLNLPRMRGPELVRRLREDATLRATPVVVLSGSNRPQDIDEVYAAGANAYLCKPLGLPELAATLEALVTWLRTIELPGRARPRVASAWS